MLGFEKLKIEIKGSSHAKSVGVVVNGLPKGLIIDEKTIAVYMQKRKSRAFFTTPRKEDDEVRIISGNDMGRTDGNTLEIEIPNNDTRSSDYSQFYITPRPSHIDYVARVKYGDNADLSGSGRFSGRMTAPLTALGGLASGILNEMGIEIISYVSKIGGIKGASYKDENYNFDTYKQQISYPLPIISEEAKSKAEQALSDAICDGDSLGGIVECVVRGLPIGLGGDLDKGIETKISSAIFTIPAVKGLEFGSGFDISDMKGSEANDSLSYKEGKVITLTNHSGGINGGITNGMELTLRVAFRPTPTISKRQNTINLLTESNDVIEAKGRHDCCIATRGVIVVESMVALAILDEILAEKENG